MSPFEPKSYTGDWIKVEREPWFQAQIWQAVGLHEFFETEFVLHCETDGFPIHFDKWDDDFLNYDYIGAPWPRWAMHFNGMRVGNGGCSLQSRKLRNFLATKDATFKCIGPEIYERINRRGMPSDVFISQYIAKEATAVGIKFAPLEVARRFSFEHPIEECPEFQIKDSFAFHGKMPWLQPYLTIPDR